MERVNNKPTLERSFWKWNPRLLAGSFLVFSLYLLITVLLASTAGAIQSVPYKVNFQGHLSDASGTPKPDGEYNMTFRLYSDSTGGTAVWTEVRETTTRVTVTDGRFSVQLGDVATLPSTVFDDQTLFFEIELPTPATATCDTASCASYTEGPMTPRQPLAASPFAFNADKLDGYDASDFAIGGQSNTFTATNLFKTDSATAFAIQNTSGGNLFAADTTSMSVSVGAAGNSVTLSGSGIQLSGSARPTWQVMLSPEYIGATFRGDGTSNIGSLSSDFCSNTTAMQIDTTACSTDGSVHNYYQWTTTESTAQDYDIYVRYQIPSGYDTGSMTNLRFAAQSTASGQPVALALYDNSGVQCSSTGGTFTDATAPAWATSTIASPLGSCTISAGSYVTFKVSMAATTGGSVRAGEISFDYRSKF